MSLNKLLMRPDSGNYSFTFPTALKSAELAGGAPRTRLDIVNNVIPMQVQWTTGQVGYEYLAQTYRFFEVNGGAHFLIDLIVDHYFIQEVEATYVPGSFSLSQQSGLVFVVQAQIYVYPPTGSDSTWPTNADYQSALLNEDGGHILL